jgi:hypothetical protein
MSIETIPEVNLDDWQETTLITEVSGFEQNSQSLVTLHASVGQWDKIRTTLCALRSSNISAILLLRKTDAFLEDEEILNIFAFLLEFDQLTVQNFLELCNDWVPTTYQPVLRNEAKTELKWFKEWSMASCDTRLHKYPGLPWRSYIRKIVRENYGFATNFLHLASLAATPENIQAMQTHLSSFLETKKKVVCLFPKKWNQTH